MTAGPEVLAFTGHRLVGGLAAERVLRGDMDRVIARSSPVRAHGSLACGADVLWAEALVDAGVELHIVLPFDQEQFLARSVRPGGPGWEGRHRAVADEAASVTILAGGGLGPAAYGLAAVRFCGRARIDAAALGGPARLGAVWDGLASSGPAGTGADVARWRAVGGLLSVIEPRGARVQGSRDDEVPPPLVDAAAPPASHPHPTGGLDEAAAAAQAMLPGLTLPRLRGGGLPPYGRADLRFEVTRPASGC